MISCEFMPVSGPSLDVQDKPSGDSLDVQVQDKAEEEMVSPSFKCDQEAKIPESSQSSCDSWYVQYMYQGSIWKKICV